MIFVDSNVPMYVVGAEHPNKHRALVLLTRLVSTGERLVTSAEVLQEILHRYHAIDRRDAIEPSLALMRDLTDEVVPLHEEDVMRAADLLGSHPHLSSRDAVHVATMQRLGAQQILSFDHGFDAVADITRIS